MYSVAANNALAQTTELNQGESCITDIVSAAIRCCAAIASSLLLLSPGARQSRKSSPQAAKIRANTGAIIGNVSDEHGTPLAGAKITLTAENAKQAKDQMTDASTDGTGEFRFDNVKPGRYSIRFDAKGLISKTETINVKAAHKTNVNVHLKLPTEPKPKSDNNNND